jgi:predicted transposase/invertase (TIGR01784 family)
MNTEISPHDAFFKDIFGREENVRAFLRDFLPKNILNRLDLGDLEIEKNSYVDERLKQHFSDMVVSVTVIPDHEAKIYFLLEHKSTSEILVGLQIFRYMANQWHDLEKRNKLYGKIPPIIPIVIYHGEKSWKVSPRFQDIVGVPSDDFRPYIPDFQYYLFDVSHVDENKLQASVIIRYFTLILKSLYSPQLRNHLPNLVKALNESMEHRQAIDYIRIFFTYLVKSTATITREDISEALAQLPQGGKEIMNTLAEQWIKEGELRGELKGELKGELRGELRGEQRGILAGLKEAIFEAILIKFEFIRPDMEEKINQIESRQTLKLLLKSLFKVQSLEEFEQLIDKSIGKTD